jgi:glutamate-1-semialdehyde 2,1-aminomutase
LMGYLASVGTYSKDPACWGLAPDTVITEAQGCKVVLNDGKTYTDYCSGLGSSLLGYAPPAYCDHVSKQLSLTGGSLSLPSYLEAQTADKLGSMFSAHVPGWQSQPLGVRFAKTGSDVTTMAIRLARAVTNRPYILTFTGHYHGWGDWAISRTSPGWGILPPDATAAGEIFDRKNWNRIREVDFGDTNIGGYYRFDEIAAIIFEVGLVAPPEGYYQFLRRLCDQTGTLLIVDEVVTGLRYALGGTCERYGIEPDLIAMGKALGNGLPVSALVGHREYLDWFSRNDPVFCSSTFWGEAVGLAAADYVLDHWGNDEVAHLWSIGEQLMSGLIEAGWNCIGHGARSLLTFENEYERAWFIQGMRARGVLMNRPNFPTLAHTEEDVRLTIEAAGIVRRELNQAEPDEIKWRVEDCLPKVLFKAR